MTATDAAEGRKGVDKTPTSGPAQNPSPQTNNTSKKNAPPPSRTVQRTRNNDGPEGSRKSSSTQPKSGQGSQTPKIPFNGNVVPSYRVTVPGSAGIVSPAVAAIPGTATVAGAAATTGLVKAVSNWHICNRSDDEIMKLTVILGDGENLVSSGWHNLEPQHCLVSQIASRTGYYFATAGPGQNWGGKSDFCASLKSRVGTVPSDCPDGYRKLPFKRVALDKSEVFSDLK